MVQGDLASWPLSIWEWTLVGSQLFPQGAEVCLEFASGGSVFSQEASSLAPEF